MIRRDPETLRVDETTALRPIFVVAGPSAILLGTVLIVSPRRLLEPLGIGYVDPLAQTLYGAVLLGVGITASRAIAAPARYAGFLRFVSTYKLIAGPALALRFLDDRGAPRAVWFIAGLWFVLGLLGTAALRQLRVRDDSGLSKGKRRYRGVGELCRDVGSLARRADLLRDALLGRTIAPDLRERIMLVVTTVNGCRACSYLHARVALVSGIASEDVEILLSGDLEASPADQVPALIYAMHWADAGGHPEEEARKTLVATYGEHVADCVDFVCNAIRIGNLIGNAFDELWSGLRGGSSRTPPTDPQSVA